MTKLLGLFGVTMAGLDVLAALALGGLGALAVLALGLASLAGVVCFMNLASTWGASLAGVAASTAGTRELEKLTRPVVGIVKLPAAAEGLATTRTGVGEAGLTEASPPPGVEDAGLIKATIRPGLDEAALA